MVARASAETEFDQYTKYRLSAPTNPNVASPGVDWTVAAVVYEWADGWDVSSPDSFCECKRAGVWRLSGQILFTSAAIRDTLYVRLHRTSPSGLFSVVNAVTGSALVAGVTCGAYFDEVVNLAVGDLITVNTYSASTGAGSCTSASIGGTQLSFIQMKYMGRN